MDPRKKVLFISACFLICAFFAFSFFASAQEGPEWPGLIDDQPGVIEGTGVYFELTNSEYLNTILWDNDAPKGPEIGIGGGTTLDISHSDLKGGKSSGYLDDPNSTLNWGPGMIDANPLFCAGPEGFYYLSQDPCQPGIANPCVDTGSDLASNLGMDLYWTRTDEISDSGKVDMGFHYGDFLFPALQINKFMISEATGGDADFLLLAGSGNANRNYILLGSVTGTDPGTPLPGGMAILPLNWDIFTNLIVDLINTPVFANFMGQLDGIGSGMATFDTLGPIPGAAGLTIHFAYTLNNPWDFVSNPVGIDIVP